MWTGLCLVFFGVICLVREKVGALRVKRMNGRRTAIMVIVIYRESGMWRECYAINNNGGESNGGSRRIQRDVPVAEYARQEPEYLENFVNRRNGNGFIGASRKERQRYLRSFLTAAAIRL